MPGLDLFVRCYNRADGCGLTGWRRIACLIVVCLPAAFHGCRRGPARVELPDIDAGAAAQTAMAGYDADGNGSLQGDELDRCPGIRGALHLYDGNQDGAVSAEEIAARIEGLLRQRVALVTLDCLVTLDGQRLSGATVRFVPEPCLGQHLKVATGTTKSNGVAAIAIDDAELPPDQRGMCVVQCGLYKIEVTHPDRKIPARYNSSTTLGQDVSPATAGPMVTLELQSRS